ncbi:MAG: peptide ABC transporter substrate-binding protein [Ruminococcus sp.]|nr:peptide ABC transporter substrate-binding protein [Ruminococcus sp.]
MEKKLNIKALILCAVFSAGMLSSCGNKDRGSGTGHMYDLSLLGNPGSLDPQYADDPSACTVIRNMYSGLLESDANGNISCRNAASYSVSPDGLTYTFELREDNFWFFDENNDDVISENEYFPVTADDYVFAFRRILDPQMQSPYAQDFSCILNGRDIISGKEFPEKAGVYAPDSKTLIISLEYPSAEFLGLLTTTAAMPCNRDFFYATSGRYGLDDRSVMSNGSFYVRQWFYDPYGSNNILYMKKNAPNSREDRPVCPSFLNFTIEKKESDIKKLMKESDTECMTTLDVSDVSKNTCNIYGSRSVTLGLVFNKDNRYLSNMQLRKALAFAIDREGIIDAKKTGDISPAYGIIPPAVAVLGRSYREMASDNQFACFDKDEAARCYQVAMAELYADTPEELSVMICAGTVDPVYIQNLSQNWLSCLGCTIGLDEVTQEEFYSRIDSGDYSIALYPVRGKNCSGLAAAEEFEQTECLRKAAGKEGFSVKIRKCADISGLVDQYAAFERDVIGQYCFVPLFYKNTYLVSKKDNEDIKYEPFSGALDFTDAKNYR